MGGVHLSEDFGRLIDWERVMTFVLKPMSCGIRDLVGDLFRVGPCDIAILFAVPEVNGDGDVRKAKVPRVQVNVSVRNQGASAVADSVSKALGDGFVVIGILQGGLIARAEETDEIADREVMLMLGSEFRAETQDKSKGNRAEFAKPNQETINPEKILRAEFPDRWCAADNLGAKQATRDESGANECIRTTAGDANDVKFLPAEVVCEFFDDRGPVQELAFRMVVGETEARAIRTDQAHALFKGFVVHGPSMEA